MEKKKRRFTLGWSLFMIAQIAVWLAMMRPSFERERCKALSQKGEDALEAFRALPPAGVPLGEWNRAVGAVRESWHSHFIIPDWTPADEYEVLIRDLDALAAGSTPALAEGRLYAALDLVAHTPRKRGSVTTACYQRDKLKQILHGQGKPAPEVVDYALAQVARSSDDPVVDLASALSRPEWRVRVMACRALKELGLSGRPEAAEVVGRALGDADALVREVAAESLGELGAAAGPLASKLTERAGRDDSPNVRRAAVGALARVDPTGSVAIPGLTLALRDPEMFVRSSAADALGKFGPKARAAAPELLRLVRDDPEESTRDSAGSALGKVGAGADVVEAALRTIRGRRDRYPRTAPLCLVNSLREAGPASASAVPLLIEMLRTGEEPGRYWILQALAAIGPAADSAIPATLDVLRTGAPEDRAGAAAYLGKTGGAPDAVILALIAALDDRSGSVHIVAKEGLARLGLPTPASVPALERLHAEAGPEARLAAENTLAAIHSAEATRHRP